MTHLNLAYVSVTNAVNMIPFSIWYVVAGVVVVALIIAFIFALENDNITLKRRN